MGGGGLGGFRGVRGGDEWVGEEVESRAQKANESTWDKGFWAGLCEEDPLQELEGRRFDRNRTELLLSPLSVPAQGHVTKFIKRNLTNGGVMFGLTSLNVSRPLRQKAASCRCLQLGSATPQLCVKMRCKKAREWSARDER